MVRVLITGMSGTGKSSALRMLAERGHRVVDTDSDEWCEWETLPNGSTDWVWRKDAITELLTGHRDDPLFVAGCKSNQGDFYPWFEHVVLLSAPVEVLLERIATRTTNPFGKSEEERAKVLADLAEFEPVLRASATAEIDTSMPLDGVVRQLEKLVGVDTATDELRIAHNTLSELYAEKLADAIHEIPADRSVLHLFRELLTAAGNGMKVSDIGTGSGRMAGYLAEQGLEMCGVDLSPEMVRVARRDYPAIPFEVADLRALPYGDGELAGAVCWYSLMYLHPEERAAAFAELARVVKPGGPVAIAFKAGDNRLRRGGQSVGVEFDIYWLSQGEVERRLADAGFRVVFWAGRPAWEYEPQPQGYVVAERVS